MLTALLLLTMGRLVTKTAVDLGFMNASESECLFDGIFLGYEVATPITFLTNGLKV